MFSVELSRRTFVKSGLVGAGAVAAAGLGLAGCSSQPADSSVSSSSSSSAAQNAKTDWTFTDQADNEVTVAVPVDRMVVMQHHSLDMLAQLGMQSKVVGTEKNWISDLSAVKSGNVLLAPYWTKPWGNPDTDSIALGELWLAQKFYPEKVPAETVQDYATRFYQDFYGVEFAGAI